MSHIWYLLNKYIFTLVTNWICTLSDYLTIRHFARVMSHTLLDVCQTFARWPNKNFKPFTWSVSSFKKFKQNMKYQSEKSPIISFSYRKVLNLGTILSFFFSKCIHVIYKNRIIGGYPSVSILFFFAFAYYIFSGVSKKVFNFTWKGQYQSTRLSFSLDWNRKH